MMINVWRKCSNKRGLSLAVILALVLAIALPVFVNLAAASDFSSAYIRLDRMKTATATDVLVVMEVPSGNTGTEAKIAVTFGAGTTVCTGATTVVTTSLPAGVSAVPGTLTAAGSSQTVTVSGVTNMTASTTYGLRITGCITNGDSAEYQNTISTLTSGDATIDTKEVATRVIANDQIVVSATVPPTFNFTLGGNTDSFTTDLSSSSIVSTTGVTATVVTNASNGWFAWVKSANGALSSASTSDTIASSGSVDGTPTTLSTGSEDYALDVDLTTDSATSGTGTVTVAAEYNGGASAGGTLTTSLNPIASADGPTDTDVITLVEKSTISSITAAATDYTDTLTVVGAGNF